MARAFVAAVADKAFSIPIEVDSDNYGFGVCIRRTHGQRGPYRHSETSRTFCFPAADRPVSRMWLWDPYLAGVP
jgi:hypothetical protein